MNMEKEMARSSPPPDLSAATLLDLLVELRSRFSNLIVAGTYSNDLDMGQHYCYANFFGERTSCLGLSDMLRHKVWQNIIKEEEED